MNNYFIYGVPGVGKTYYSLKYSKEQKIPVYELDSLRAKGQKIYTRKQKPFLYVGTSQAYIEFGEFNKDNVIKGFIEVRKVMNSFVIEFIESLEDGYIVEGAFIKPQSLLLNANGLLVVQENESIHKKQFFTNRERTQGDLDSFNATRIIQQYLTEEAVKLDIPIITSRS